MAFMYFTWRLSHDWAAEISPPPSPVFIDLMNDFFWLHFAFFCAFILQTKGIGRWSNELLLGMILLCTVVYFWMFLRACLEHIEHASMRGYRYYQVEDVVHFFVLVEIVTFVSSQVVIMTVLIVASCVNVK